MLRHLPLKELQVRNAGPVASCFLCLCAVLSCFADVAQDIILDTKTELTIEVVQRWLSTTDTYALKSKDCMEEVD